MYQQSINYVSKDDFEHLSSELTDQGFKVYELDGSRISNAKTFFAEVLRKLPLEPSLPSGMVHYDGLVDSLWYGLYELECRKVAILWIQADNIAQNSLDDFRTILDCFKRLSEDLASSEFTLNNPVSLLVFLFGLGDQFK